MSQAQMSRKDEIHPGTNGPRVNDPTALDPVISVCMPAYNAAGTIAEAIRSVLRQNVDLELIVVDDASTDNTQEIVQSFDDPRIRLYRNEKGLGASGSRNRAVSLARGRYIAFLDSDDCWADDKLKKQLDVIGQTGCVLCCTGRELMTPEGVHTGRVIGVGKRISYRQLLRSNFINCSSVLIRTEAAKEFPMEHEDSHEDYITWLKVLKKYGEAAGIDEPLLIYRLSKSGKSGSKLKSAGMTFKVYRYMGFGPVRSAILFISYALHGVYKYAKA